MPKFLSDFPSSVFNKVFFDDYAMEENLWSNTLLTDLPFEVLEHILAFDEISFKDICRFSRTCSSFRRVGNSNKLWRIKYRQKWSELSVHIEGPYTDWKKEFYTRYKFEKVIKDELNDMADEFYHLENLSNDAFCKFESHLGKHPLAYRMLMDELEKVIHDGRCSDNLTHKYYAKKVLRYFRHVHLQEVWRDFLKDPQQNQVLEIGACLLSQWCQPTRVCCTKNVMKELDALALKVKEKVREVNSQHPVLQMEPALHGPNLTKSLWNTNQCRVILLCINNHLFNDLKFVGNPHDFFSPENSFIDQVLIRRTGIPISLGILYNAIARRLGVYLQPVNFPGHFLLKWHEHPHLDDPEYFIYIDVYEGGLFRNRRSCYDLVPGIQVLSDSWFEPCSLLKVLIRMCWNLVEVGRQLEGFGEGPICLCNALELLSILNPDDVEHKLLLARVYLHLCISQSSNDYDIMRVISLIQDVSSRVPASTGIVGFMYQAALNHLEAQKNRQTRLRALVPKTREKECPVKFAVGMIMKHMKYNYRCVIYGWDPICAASKDWIKQMGVCNLAYKDLQPFYHVLANDGTNRYAAQENLEIDLECKPVSHIEVGRYFEAYRGTYYVPNSQKNAEYPDDAAGRENLFSFGEYFLYKDKSPFSSNLHTNTLCE